MVRFQRMPTDVALLAPTPTSKLERSYMACYSGTVSEWARLVRDVGDLMAPSLGNSHLSAYLLLLWYGQRRYVRKLADVSSSASFRHSIDCASTFPPISRRRASKTVLRPEGIDGVPIPFCHRPCNRRPTPVRAWDG